MLFRSELPEGVIRGEMDDILHRFVHRLEDQNLTLADYFNATGITQEQFLADLRSQAEHGLKTRILLDAVVADADLEVTDEEIDSVLHEVASQSENPLEFLRAIRGTPQELSLRSDMLRDKALKLILDSATPVDEDGNVIDLTMDHDEEPVAGEVVEGHVAGPEDVVEGEIVEGEVVSDAPQEIDQEKS